jgi:hypothetical protein
VPALVQGLVLERVMEPVLAREPVPVLVREPVPVLALVLVSL